MTPREIYKTSLNIFNGDRYDNLISKFELNEKYPEYGRCFYHDIFFVFSIKGDVIDINTNLLCVRQFELDCGRKWSHLDHLDPNINFEDSLSNVIQFIRNDKIGCVIG